MWVADDGGKSPVPSAGHRRRDQPDGGETTTDGGSGPSRAISAEPTTSSVSARFAGVIASSVIVPLAADGTICLKSMMTTDVIVDVTGWFGAASGLDFVPIDPIRLADTRSFDSTLNPWTRGQMVRQGR